MHAKIVMTSSSLFLGFAGLILLFAPGEVAAFLGLPAMNPLHVLTQLMGALYVSLALMNWSAKDSRIGGIYARPTTLGNFTHFFIGLLVLVRYQISDGVRMSILIILVAYTVFATLFGWLLFRSTGLNKG